MKNAGSFFLSAFKMKKALELFGLLVLISMIACVPTAVNNNQDSYNLDPLPSWNNGPSKTSIIDFVQGVTKEGADSFIPVTERIAVFDNDGTLWSEQPAYFQLYFAMDRIKELAPENPEWKDVQPYKAVIENDMEALAKEGEHGLMKLVLTTHSGMNTDEFSSSVKEWVRTAKHPTKNVGFDKLVYQPMLELLDFLRENEFKTYIVSGGGVDFMRAIVTEVYGIPEEQILGSTIKTDFELVNGKPQIIRLAELDFIDDKEGKPINIHKIIGKKPIFCGGNSDGDLAMMQWTASNPAGGFMLYVHHTDSIREWAYDRNSHIGKFNKGWDEAIEKGWTIVDMENDWKVIYPFDQLEAK